MRTMLGTFLHDESGATAIEYGLIVSLIGISLIIALQELGQTLAGMFEQISRALDTAASRMR